MKHQHTDHPQIQRDDKSVGKTKKESIKQPFVPPRLVVHGSITELTAFTGSGSI